MSPFFLFIFKFSGILFFNNIPDVDVLLLLYIMQRVFWEKVYDDNSIIPELLWALFVHLFSSGT